MCWWAVSMKLFVQCRMTTASRNRQGKHGTELPSSSNCCLCILGWVYRKVSFSPFLTAHILLLDAGQHPSLTFPLFYSPFP